MGAETRIAVAEDIVLDFAGLFSPIEGEKQAPESPTEPLLRAGEYKTITEPQKPAERLTEGLEGQQAKKLYLDTQREREDRQRSLEVYRTYQENIKTSSQLQTEILKGLKAGEDVYSLFLKAAKAIALFEYGTIAEMYTAKALFDIYRQRHGVDADRLWDTMRVLSFAYDTGRIQGIREERAKARGAARKEAANKIK